MNSLWYKECADDWNKALPVGNGRLGGMVYGRPGHEIIQLNEESIWSGTYTDRNNRSCKKNLPEIRKLIREGRLQEAQELGYEAMTGNPSQQPVYQTAGELHIDFYTEQTRGLDGPLPERKEAFRNISLYRRELDLDTAVVSTSFMDESSMPSTADFSNSHGSSITYNREVFVPAGLDVMVIHITASVPNSIYFRANFDRWNFSTEMHALSDDTIVMKDTHGVPYAAMATAIASGGKVCTRGAFLVVEGADEVTLYVDIETAFRKRHYVRKGGNVSLSPRVLASRCENKALEKICYASTGVYADIKSVHEAEYAALFNTVKLELADEKAEELSSIPTDLLLKEHAESPLLAQLYWNFDRYLLISSSRNPGKLPANLQGLWNKDMDPPWGSKYTININTEMNYWPACMTGLAETEIPLMKLMQRAYKHGVVTARDMYGADGFVAHHNLDLWGDTAPQDRWLPGTYWVLGAAWLSTHIWEHYEYTQDKKFLKTYFYLMKRSCDFFVDYLVLSDDGKHLIVNPSVSPENTYRLPNGETGSFCAGTDMDNRILEHLFTSTLKACRELGMSDTDVDYISYQNVLSRIEGVAVTAENTIREWPVKYEEVEKGHRHISQLYGLFPGHSIDYYRTPELAEAARNTIEKRLANGGGHTGWSQAWIMNFWASLHDSEKAYKSLVALFEKSTLPNLFDNHPPFQIDGNFGSCCAMTRFIVQSEIADGAVEISLLPSLPSEWKSGKLEGVVLKGNLRLDIQWEKGKLTGAKVYTVPGTRYKEDVVVWYADHKYEGKLVDGRLDLLNILPSTI